MIEVRLEGRHYRTDNSRSDVSGRLVMVESMRGNGQWRAVKNVSRREDVLRTVEALGANMLRAAAI